MLAFKYHLSKPKVFVFKSYLKIVLRNLSKDSQTCKEHNNNLLNCFLNGKSKSKSDWNF